MNKVLFELKLKDVPMIEVYNKIDISGAKPAWQKGHEESADKVWLSAYSQQGVDLLLSAIEERLNRTHLTLDFSLPLSEARLRAQFYQADVVKNEAFDEDGNWLLTVDMAIEKWHQMAKANGSEGQFVAELLAQHDQAPKKDNIFGD
mgnify:FL=1